MRKDQPLAESQRSVLVVDDEAEIRSLLTDFLKDAGYKVRTAKTAAEAVAEVAKDLPDLVMMDVKLPDQDGIALLRQLKREHSELEVIVMTAFSGSSTAIKAMEHGAYDYVTKPFELDDLAATLRRVFEHADMSSEVSALRLELGKSAAERERIVGSSKPMLEVYKLIGKVAEFDLEAWERTIDELERRSPERLALIHFGIVDDAVAHLKGSVPASMRGPTGFVAAPRRNNSSREPRPNGAPSAAMRTSARRRCRSGSASRGSGATSRRVLRSRLQAGAPARTIASR